MGLALLRRRAGRARRRIKDASTSSASGLAVSKGPLADHIPQPHGTGTLTQLAKFGTRSTTGLTNIAAKNTRGLLAGAGAGIAVGAPGTAMGSWISAQ